MRKTITETLVRRMKAPPDGGRTQVYDALVPGFGVRVTEGARSWFVMTRLRTGGQVRVTLGRFPGVGVAAARAEARKAIERAAAGEDPRPVKTKDAPTTPGTFASVAAAFLERGARQTAGEPWTAEQARIINRELLKPWRTRPIASITRRDVVKLLDGIAGRGAPVQANRVLAVVRHLFTWAVNQDLAPGSPCVRLARPGGRERTRERVLSASELRALWAVWDAPPANLGWIFTVYCKVLLLTGQRRGEVAAMRWADLDLDSGLWTIPTAKGGHAHEVPIPSAVVAILRTIPEQGEYLFTTKKTRPISGFSDAKEKIAKAANLASWCLHDLRRSAASHMAALGVTKETIKRVLGHAERDVTETYVRFGWLEQKRDALERWAAYVERIVAEADPRAVQA